MVTVRYADNRDDDEEQNKILIFMGRSFAPDVVTDIEGLVALRGEIDRFLLLDRHGMLRS